jgi:hypothetical protein
MALAEIDQHDERTEELDIEAVLDFAERVSASGSKPTWPSAKDSRPSSSRKVSKSRKGRFEHP